MLKKIIGALLVVTLTLTTVAAPQHKPLSAKDVAKCFPARVWKITPGIEDRAFWDNLRQSGYGKHALKDAKKLLKSQIVLPTEADYRDFRKTGSRKAFESRYYHIQAILGACAFAACLTGEQQYVDKVEQALEALINVPIWVLPAHDTNNVNIKGKYKTIDLGVAQTANEVLTVRRVLATRLNPELCAKIDAKIKSDVLDPFFAAIDNKRPREWWIEGTNNWNAFCFGYLTQVILQADLSPQDRHRALAFCLEKSNNFLKGFGPKDGYCTEGPGYWAYGFGAYTRMALCVWRASGGKINMFDNPQTKLPADYPEKILLLPKIFPAFADAEIKERFPDDILAIRDFLRDTPSPYVKSMARDRGLFCRAASSIGMMSPECDPIAYAKYSQWVKNVAETAELADYSEFADSGVFICRPGATSCRLILAVKGGNNGESHNHNDVGSFIVCADDVILLIDPGKTIYTAKTFSKRRYENRLIDSYGHSVPYLNHRTQRSGKIAFAQLKQHTNTPKQAEITLDFAKAYPKEVGAKSLLRKFVYNRDGAGKITITDDIKLQSPQEISSALMTFGTWEKTNSGIRVSYQGKKIHIAINTHGVPYTITDELINDDIKCGIPARRIAVTLNKPVAMAVIEYTIQHE